MSRITEEPEIYESESQYLLWSAHLKATPGRMELIDVLLEEKHPVSVARIEELLKKSLKNASIASISSIYRALESLVSAGLVNQIDIGDGRATYEISHGRKHHHHLICTNCGDIEDVEKCSLIKFDSSVLSESKKFQSVSRHSLEFFGMCKKCAK